MDFLFQFQVKADDVYFKEPLYFDLDDIGITLYMDDEKSWISKGKKVHFTVTGDNKNKAYELIWYKMVDFNKRLMFLTGESIVITHLEFIIFDQAGEETRDIFFRDIKLPGKHELNYRRISHHTKFFFVEMCDNHKYAIAYFNQAILSELSHEQFKSLFLALEQLAGSELVEAKCDNQDCGGILKCPKCDNTKKYPRVTVNRLQEFIDSTNYSQKFEAGNISAKDITKIRARLSHATSNGSKKSPLKINDINHQLSLLIRWYLEEQYGILWPGSSVVKSGVVAGIDKQFKTEHPDEKFALDIPPIEDFENNRENTRWLI